MTGIIVVPKTSFDKAFLKDMLSVSKSSILTSIQQPSVQLSQDENGEYTLKNIDFDSLQDVSIYDGEKKIADITYTDGKLSAIFYCEEQVNISSALTCQDISIKTAGPLFFSVPLSTSGNAVFDVKEVCFARALQIGGKLTCHSQYTLAFDEAVSSRELDLKSENLLTAKRLVVKKSGVVATKNYKNAGKLAGRQLTLTVQEKLVNSGSMTLLKGSALFVANFKNKGKFSLQFSRLEASNSINRDCFEAFNADIKVSAVFDSSDSAKVLKLEDSRLQAKEIKIVTPGKCICSKIHGEQDVNISGAFDITEDSSLHSDNKLLLNGVGTVADSSLSANSLGIVDPRNLSKNQIDSQFILLQASKPDFKVDHCHLKAPRLKLICSGDVPLCVMDSTMNVDHYVQSGDVDFYGTSLHSSKKQGTYSIRGHTKLVASRLEVESGNILFDYNKKLNLSFDSQVIADSFQVNGDVDARYSTLTTNQYIQNEGELRLHHAALSVKQLFSIKKTNAQFLSGSLLSARQVQIDGNVESLGSRLIAKEKTVQFSSSSMKLQQSNIALGQASLAGNMATQQSRLSADQLKTFSVFNAEEAVMEVARDFYSSKTGKVGMSKAQVNIGGSFDSFGHAELSEVKAETNTMTVRHDSTFKMHRSAVKGKLLTQYGDLNAETELNNQFPLSEFTVDELAILKKLPEPKAQKEKALTDFEKALYEKIQSLTSVNQQWKRMPFALQEIKWLKYWLEQSGQEQLNAKLLVNLPLLSFSQQFYTGADSQTTLSSLAMEVESFNHLGKMKIFGDVRLTGKYFYNAGYFFADENIFLGFDRSIFNAGEMTGRHVNFSSPVIFNMHLVRASSYTGQGLLNINAGLLSANTIYNGGFLSLNSGFMLPNLSNPLDLFTFNNLWLAGRTLASTLLPQHMNLIGLVGMVPGVWSTSKNLYRLARERKSKGIFSMRAHELVPLICQVSSAVNLGKNFASSAKCTHQSYKKSSENVKNDEPTSIEKQSDSLNSSDQNDMVNSAASSNINWHQVVTDYGLSLIGNQTEDAIFSTNLGVSASINTARTNLCNFNLGLDVAADNYFMNTRYACNMGYEQGRNFTYSADYLLNMGTQRGKDKFYYHVNHLADTASSVIEGQNACDVKIGDFNQQGQFNLSRGKVEIDSHHMNDTASSHFDQLKVDIGQQTVAGHLAIQKSVVTIENRATESTGKIDHQASTVHVTCDTVSGEHHYQNSVYTSGNRYVDKSGYVKHANTLPEPAKENDKDDSEVSLSSENQTQAKRQQFDVDIKKEQVAGKVEYDGVAVKIDHRQISNSGQVNHQRAVVDIGEDQVEGKVSYDQASGSVDQLIISTTALVDMANSALTGSQLHSNGVLSTKNVGLEYDTVHLSKWAQENFGDKTSLVTKKLYDASKLNYSGQVYIKSDHYEHAGHIHFNPNVVEESYLSIVAQTAKLSGSAQTGDVYYSFSHFDDANKFVTGVDKYRQYQSSGQFYYHTDDNLTITGALDRTSDVAVEAGAIHWDAVVKNNQQLGLRSSKGDISVTRDVEAGSVWIDSKKNVYTNHKMDTAGNIHLNAEGSYYNLGGNLNGENIYIHASDVFNVTKGSEFAKQNQAYEIGQGGMINGRIMGTIEATQRNIENHGGVIRAGDYQQLVAAGDVKNLCNIKSYRGKYDVIQEFDPGLIAGGKGEFSDGLGLYVQARGKVFADASDFIANGDVYIDGKQGIKFNARHHTYISKDEVKRKWHGGKKHIRETSTTVRGCNIQSSEGRNIMRSDEGGVKGVATNFVSAGGTDIYAKQKVELFSLKTQDRREVEKRGAFGLSKSKRSELHESATPTLILDNGITRIHSAEEDVDLRGALLVGEGDLYIKAGEKIRFGCDVLNHEIHEKTQSFGVSAPGMGALNAIRSGGNLWDAVTAEDATLAKMNSLAGSGNAAELLTNASNLGIDLLNTSNNIMRGFANDNLSEELLARYGLGGEDGFSPTITFSFTKTKTNTTYQTLGQGGVNRGGNAYYEAGEGIELHNGVRVRNDGHTEINTPEIKAYAAALHSSYSHRTQTVNVGITATGDFVSAGGSVSSTSSKTTAHVNAELSSGGHLKLHHQGEAIKKVSLNGANIIAHTLDAHMRELEIKDQLDVTQTKTKSASVSTSGQVSAYKGKGYEATVGQSSGIHVEDGLNTNGHTFEVDHAVMHGGKLTTQGENQANIHSLEATEVKETKHYDGIGVSFNVNDVSRLTGNAQPGNKVGESAIATASITVDRERYDARVAAVAHGEQGTQLNIEHLAGQLHTDSSNGRTVTRDSSMHLTVDVPVTNQAYLQQAQQNLQQGTQKIAEKLGFQAKLDGAETDEHPVITKDRDIPEAEDLDGQEKILSVDAEEEQAKIDEEQKALSIEDTEKFRDNLPELTPELFEQALESMPQAEKEAFGKDLQLAEDELKNSGIISQETQERLMSRFSEAMLNTLKTSGEYGWSKLVSALGQEYSDNVFKMLLKEQTRANGGVKLYMTSKGLMFTFAMNLAFSRPGEGQLKEAAIKTTDNMLVGFIVNAACVVAGVSSAPVSLAIFTAEIADLFYDEQKNIQQLQYGMDLQKEGKRIAEDKDGSWWRWFTVFALYEEGRDVRRTAAQARGVHEALKILHPIELALQPKKVEKPVVKEPNPPSMVNEVRHSPGFFRPHTQTDNQKVEQTMPILDAPR